MSSPFNPYMVGSATRSAAVTISDSTIVNCRAVYVGTSGNIALVLVEDSSAVTFKNVASGTLLPFACNKIMSTNTTASDIVALF